MKSIFVSYLPLLALLVGCASPPRFVAIANSSSDIAAAHRLCFAEMHSANSPSRRSSSGYATGAITANLMTTLASAFQIDNLGFDTYRSCMARLGWREEAK